MTDFTVQAVIAALAAKLGELFPGVMVYSNPNQQGTILPAFFITLMPTNTKKQVGNRWMREIGVDLVYNVELDLPDLNDRYLEAAERLDEAMELLRYQDGFPLRTTQRKWFVELDSLHYQCKVTARASLPVKQNPMQAIEGITEEVRE